MGLDPLVTWLDARRLRRTYAAPLVVLALVLSIVGFGYLAGSSLVAEAALLGGRLGEVQQDLMRRTPPWLLQFLPKASEGGAQVSSYVMWLGQSLVSGLLSIGVALVLTVYFLLDGRRTAEWLIAFAPRPQRPRVRETAEQARLQTVLAYVRGNLVTSALAAVCESIAMLLLDVPGALLLALLTGILDLIPVIGIILSAFPAILLGLTVSLSVGLWLSLSSTPRTTSSRTTTSFRRSTARSCASQASRSSPGSRSVPSWAGWSARWWRYQSSPSTRPWSEFWLTEKVGPATVQDHQRIENSEQH